MLCPYCKEKIADGALKCKHCESMLNQTDPPPVTPSSEQKTSISAVSDPELTARIDALTLSNQLKTKLHFVHNNIKGTKFGLPDYGLKGSALWQTFNWWAFFFTAFYYFAKGVHQKGLVLLGVSIGVAVISELLRLPTPIWFGLSIGIGAVAMQSAYYDIYRKEVLKQEFWW